MKIVILKDIYVVVEKPRLNEAWPKYLNKHDTVSIEKIEPLDNTVVNLVLDNGDVFLEVPSDAFEMTVSKKPEFSF